jgi:hypothetical protein
LRWGHLSPRQSALWPAADAALSAGQRYELELISKPVVRARQTWGRGLRKLVKGLWDKIPCFSVDDKSW